MLFFVFTGLLIAAVATLAGYLLGFSQGYAQGRVLWKAVFRELRDYDNGELLPK